MENVYGAKSRWERDRLTLAVTSLPGLVGLGLGTIYALGAIETLTQFSGAGLDAPNLFPLVPLDEVLAKGIELSLVYALVAGLLGLLALLMAFATPAAMRRLIRRAVDEGVLPDPGNSRGAKVLSVLVLPFAIGGLCLLVLDAPWLTWASIPFAYLYFAILGRRIAERVGQLRAAALLTIVLIFALGVFTAVAYPDPLPRAKLWLNSGETRSGELAASTEEGWYLKKDGNVVLIPNRRVVEAELHPVSREVDQSTLPEIIGRCFS